jgi:hypothetical protein
MLTIHTYFLSGGRIKAVTGNDFKPVTMHRGGVNDLEDHQAVANAMRRSVIAEVRKNYPDRDKYPFQGAMIGGHHSKQGMVWVFAADEQLPALDRDGAIVEQDPA